MRFLLLIALSVGPVTRQEPGSPLDSGLIRAVELERPPGTLVQHFLLDRERPLAPAPGADALPAGLMRFVSGPDPEGGLRVELELLYFDPELRVLHLERATESCRRLVFREVRARAGRSLFLNGSPREGYESSELGGDAAVRRVLDGTGEFPLFLVEAARRGLALPASIDVFEPLAGRFEAAALLASPGERSTLELLRPDGSRRFRVVFRAGALVEWRWQAGAPVARAIPQEEYEALRRDHEDRVRVEAADAARGKRAAERARHPTLRSGS